ncbi:MAG TPA: SRPBCC family protein [Mycobacteriales bacterium]|nr:SRPBCC family protein [Mycobacteriales bacterium]
MSADRPGRSVSRSVVVDAPARKVFDMLADPRQHPVIDGSGTVRASLSGPPRLHLGASFGMRMHLLAPYRIRNTVVEFDEDRRIAWRHFNRHVWRYEIVEGPAGTTVTETFDWAPARAPWILEALDVPAKNARSMERTLEQLKAHVEKGR